MDLYVRVLGLAVPAVLFGLTSCSSSQITVLQDVKEVRVHEQPVIDVIVPRPLPEPVASPTTAPDTSPLHDVFFDFNRATLTKEARERLRRNAELLRGSAPLKVIVEGHCDERGSAEYNMVLGERRARIVRDALADFGVPADRIHVATYGEELPFCTEPTEECWAQNRRAHFMVRDDLVSAR